MILVGIGRNRWRWIFVELVLLLLASAASAAGLHFGLHVQLATNLINTLRIALLAALFIFGWRDILMLFRRPAKGMGTGLGRSWSVARTTVAEAWASRVWLLPVIWVLCAILLIAAVRPFDPSERIPLYINMLVTSQQLLVLLMMWVMACISLPRERERKTIITTASKPLSRLEIVLGKIAGFSIMTAVMLLLMYVASLVILHITDYRLRVESREAYRLQKEDFAQKIAHPDLGQAATPPNERLSILGDEGSLYAYNYITVPPGGLSILGRIDFKEDPPARWIRGASEETIVFKFSPRLEIPRDATFKPSGQRPAFVFHFDRFYAGREVTPKIRVTLLRDRDLGTPPRPQQVELTLNRQGAAYWEIQNIPSPNDQGPPDPDEVFTTYNQETDILRDMGEVTLTVACTTPGVMLRVYEGSDPDPNTGLLVNDSAPYNVYFYPVPTAQAPPFVPKARPTVRGFERRDRQEAFGPKKDDPYPGVEAALYRFSGADLKKVPLDEKGNFTLSLNLQTNRAGNSDRPTIAQVNVLSLDNKADAFAAEPIEVIERRPIKVSVPARYLGDKDPSRRSDMLVAISCKTQDHSLSIIEDSVRIELPQSIFAVNLLKSEGVILLETMLLIVICVACSVRVGWAVAMLCAGVCFVFGNFSGMLVGLQGQGLAALNYSYLGTESSTFKFFDSSTGMLWNVLAFISKAMPNFTVFNPTDSIINLQNMPSMHLFSNGIDALVSLVPFLCIAYLLFRKQELG